MKIDVESLSEQEIQTLYNTFIEENYTDDYLASCCDSNSVTSYCNATYCSCYYSMGSYGHGYSCTK
ncbi:hypothetical protein IJ182_01315 [bacterium]|nr:hypothetical protein [bacterium]